MGFLNNDGYVGIGRQASGQGTAVAPSTFVRFITCEPLVDNEWMDFREGGFGREGRFTEKVGIKSGGTFVVKGRADIAGLLSCMTLGSDVKTGSAVPYLHTITPAALQWWSIEIRRLNSTLVERHHDCKINSLKLTGKAGDMLELTVEFVSLAVSRETATSPSYSTEDILKFLHGTFTIFGAASTEIEDFALTINNNLEPIQTNGLEYAQLVEKDLDIDITMTVKALALAEYAKINFGGATGTAPDEEAEKSAVTLVFNNGGATTAEREISISLPEITYKAAGLSGLNAAGEVYRYAVSGIATYSGASLITMAIQNADATAYDGA